MLSPEKNSTPPVPVNQQKLEKLAFLEEMQRKRLLQLEALEHKLTGFAKFNQAHSKKKGTATVRQVAAGRQLRSIENLHRSDIDNNNDVDGIEFTASPSFIKGTMHDYQVRGLNWLISMYKNNLNGILADEMGLGKTIQAISMIGYLMTVCNLKGPFLVVVPLTTLLNWMKEFARFLPSAKVFRAHGTGDHKRAVLDKLRVPKPSWNVAITTYEFISFNASTFNRINFHYAIIDEGHRAKNELSLFAKVLRGCNIQSMVLITGTPVHNNLHELWAERKSISEWKVMNRYSVP